MTKLDQIKILDNKIKANRAQFMLDRKNAEISAKSSGELDKYEYLTGEDLGYKPDALTQAKFEYSPLGKVFTAGLDKDDKKEGLFKRLRSIEDKTTTHPKLSRGFFPQLPYGKRDDGDDGNTGQYKILDDIKKKLKDKVHLEQSADELFNRIIRASKNLEGKKYVINRDDIIQSRVFNSDYERLIKDYLDKKIEYKDIVKEKELVDVGIKFYEENKNYGKNTKEQVINSKKVSKTLEEVITAINEHKLRRAQDFIREPVSTDLSWMYDPARYQEANDDAQARYRVDRDSFELLSIQSFLDDINNEHIKNRKDVREEFHTVKQNLTSEALRDIVKELEYAIFGPNEFDDEYKSDKSDKSDKDDYEESIAE